MISRTAKQTVAWNGRAWDARCAFHALLSVTEHHEEVLRKSTHRLALYKRLAEKHGLCAGCSKPLGNNYKILGDNVYHVKCLYDIGGEQG